MILYDICLSLTSLNMIISRSTHIDADGTISFLFMAEYFSTGYIYHILFVHSQVDGHLGCFHVLAVVNSAAMNAEIHLTFQIKSFRLSCNH